MTQEISIGDYTVSTQTLCISNTPPETKIYVMHKSGEGLEVSLEKFNKFFDEIWKDF